MYRKKENETLDVDLPRAGSVHVFPSPTYGWLHEHEYDPRVFVHEAEL